MQQWEYMRLPVTDFARGHVVGNKRMEPKFKSEGEDGWEMFAVNEFHCYFKRQTVSNDVRKARADERRERHRPVEKDEIRNARAERIRRQQGF
jgi:hypothetical protein